MSKWGKEEQITLDAIKSMDMHGSILNLAAGDGRFNSSLLQNADKVVAVDIQNQELDILMKTCPEDLKDKLEIMVADITLKLPFPDNAFDGVFMTGTLHLFKKDAVKKIIGEIKRVLKVGGKVIIDFATDIKRLDKNGNMVVLENEGDYKTGDACDFLREELKEFNIDIKISSFAEENLNDTAGYRSIIGNFLLVSGVYLSIPDIPLIMKEKFAITVESIEFMGEGYDSKSFLINDEYLFKFAKHDDAKNSYKREKTILNYLRKNFKSSIAIPQIDYFDEVGIMGYKMIKGRPLTKEMYESISDDEKNILHSDLASFLKSLHSLEVSSLDEFKYNLYDAYQKDLDLLKDNVFSKITEEEQRYIETYILDILGDDKLFKRNLCLCHNDLSINHILIGEDNKVSGIIDFGDACIIEDYRDFMYLLEESDEKIGQDFGLAILEKYQLDIIITELIYISL